MKAKVYLVGAGPGDPELLTLKALRLLRTAEAVLHDDLVAPEILKLIPPTAQIYNVGKRCGKKKILQGEINGLMVALASSGLRVVRLKGGEIVPGVTSALGAAARAQIPLTHRRASSALVLMTAHRASENRASEKDATDWSKLVTSGATLVIYMPGQDYSDIARKLIAAGLAGETPCAIISRATTKRQQTHRTTAIDLHRAPQLAAPTLLVVGEVVGLADPAAMVDEFVVPGLPPGNDSLLPAAIFQNVLPGGATPGSR